MGPCLFIHCVGYSMEQSILWQKANTDKYPKDLLPNNDTWFSLWHSYGSDTGVFNSKPFI